MNSFQIAAFLSLQPERLSPAAACVSLALAFAGGAVALAYLRDKGAK